MKSITNQLKGQKNENQSEESIDDIDAFLMQETVSSTIHFLWGYYKCYCRMNSIESLTAEDFFSNIDSLPHHEDDDQKKKYLLENNNNLNKFLHWYFYE